MPDTEKCGQNKAAPYITDRRQWPRSRSDAAQVTVWTSATEYQAAEVHDESLTGLAVLLADVSRLTVEREVRVAFPDRQMWAIVKHIQPAVNGRHRVGLEWGCSEGRFLSG